MVYVFLAEGFEEIEALAPVDILRRGGIDVKTVGIGSKRILGAHNIEVCADISEEEASFENLEAVILPGGMPGTLNLQRSETVNKFIDCAADNKLLLGAICAAPMILGEKGLLVGKSATCFNGFEKHLAGADVKSEPIVCDGNIITSFGAGAALDFGFALLAYLTDSQKSEDLKKSMRYIK